MQPHRRSRRLFTGDALTTLPSGGPAAQILADSLLDLTQICELIQLGIGLFIDRPLGHAKEPGEPDYTPLLAHEAFSKSIARQRLKELATLAQELSLDLPADFFASIERDLEAMPGRGVPAAQLAEPARPTAALTDVRRVAEDFVIVRTMPKGLAEMLAYFELPPVPTPHVVANIQAPRGPVLAFFDAEYRIVLEAAVDPSGGFVRRAGVELPVAGLRIVSIDSREVSDLRAPRREPGGDSGGLPPV